MTTRRGFLGAILAAAAAPAVIKAEALMPVRKIITPPTPTEAYIDNLARSIRTTGRLIVGDIITISGVAGSFVVTGVNSGDVASLSQFMSPTLPEPYARRVGM